MLHSIVSSFLTSDLLGKAIYLALLLLSVLGWWVIFEKFKSIQNSKQRQRQFFHDLEENQQRWIDWLPSVQSCHLSQMYRSMILQARRLLQKNQQRVDMLALTMEDIEILDHSANAKIEELTYQMRERMEILALSIPLSPFLGLLGTVWGMLGAFYHLRSSVGLSNDRVFESLSLALGSTVAGLLVAIPALISYYWISHESAKTRRQLISLKTRILDLCQTQYRVHSFEIERGRKEGAALSEVDPNHI